MSARSITAIRKGDRFTFADFAATGRTTSLLCRDADGDPILGTLVGYEISSVRSGDVYFFPVFDCCGCRHDWTVTGAKARPSVRPLDEFLAGAISTGIGGRNPAPIAWTDRRTR